MLLFEEEVVGTGEGSPVSNLYDEDSGSFLGGEQSEVSRIDEESFCDWDGRCDDPGDLSSEEEVGSLYTFSERNSSVFTRSFSHSRSSSVSDTSQKESLHIEDVDIVSDDCLSEKCQSTILSEGPFSEIEGDTDPQQHQFEIHIGTTHSSEDESNKSESTQLSIREASSSSLVSSPLVLSSQKEKSEENKILEISPKERSETDKKSGTPRHRKSTTLECDSERRQQSFHNKKKFVFRRKSEDFSREVKHYEISIGRTGSARQREDDSKPQQEGTRETPTTI